MKPKKSTTNQYDLFKSRLDQMLNMTHPLIILAREIDWDGFDEKFGKLYKEDFGRPGLPTRLMVGLHYLKAAFNESDESVVERFLENPYWQYFCGYDFFLHASPLDPSSLVRWRNRVGPDGAQKLLKETIEVAKKKKHITRQEMKKVNVDTTVQEKAIAFPTDAKLCYTMRQVLVKEAGRRGIRLRQTYRRVAKKALVMQGRYRHGRKYKRAAKAVKKLKTYLGRVTRDIRRKAAVIDEALEEKLVLAERIFNQQRSDKNKVYSIHAPEVECIAKGKAHKKYEFGCKVSVVSTSRNNWVLGVKAFHGNPYDGHTLAAALAQAERIVEMEIGAVYCDRGYRGVLKELKERSINIVGGKLKRLTRGVRKWFKRRSAIEPIISHIKQDHRMGRNYLLGVEGDMMNALFAGCGFNMRKLLRVFFCHIFLRPILAVFGDPDSRKSATAGHTVLCSAA